jgi:hypothetical protein
MKNFISVSKTQFIRTCSSVAVFAIVALMAIPAITFADTFNRQLQMGSTGTDVRNLQSFLAGDETIYPQGRVTGYYGFLTKAAVSNFQKENDISPVGRVGPATLPVLNLQYDLGVIGGGDSGGGSADDTQSARITSVVVNTSLDTAAVRWDTSRAAKGVVYYSEYALTLGEHENSVDVSGSSVRSDTEYKTSQNVYIPNLKPNTIYHYLIYSTSQPGGVSVTMPSTFRTLAN